MTKLRLKPDCRIGSAYTDTYSAYEFRAQKIERTEETAQNKETKILMVGGVSVRFVDREVAVGEERFSGERFIGESLNVDYCKNVDPLEYDSIFEEGKIGPAARLYGLDLKVIPQEGNCIVVASKRIYPYQISYNYSYKSPAQSDFESWALAHNSLINWNVYDDTALDEFMNRMESDRFDAWEGVGNRQITFGSGLNGRYVMEWPLTKAEMDLTQRHLTRLITEINGFTHLRNTDLFDILSYIGCENYR